LRHVIPVVDAIDENHAEGKQRNRKTSITLGFTGKRRSKHQMATFYYKPDELMGEWKNPGQFQSMLLETTKDSIRGEMKFYSMGLKALDLQYGAKWLGANVATLFFDALDKFKVNYAIQPLLTAEALAVLSKAELNVYQLWLHGKDVADQFRSRSSAWKYIKAIKEKTGFDMSGARRPDALPTINLADIYSPANVLPIPDWLFPTEYYVPPTGVKLPRRRGKGGPGSAPLDPNAGQQDE